MNDHTPTTLTPTPMPMQVKPKSPQLGALVSFFIPGLGSIINGVGKGSEVLLLWLIAWPLIPVNGLGILLGFIAWIVGIHDGYKSAKNWNTAHGVLS